MRPIKLRISAFGSFPGTEVVDFEALAPRGLFVVSGETGTGKTTIFDAMCWALYGEMPKKESHAVRSDHVGEDVRTEVEFTFETGGARYVVTRNPEQQRRAARGNGLVKESAAATLVRMTETGTEPLTTKTSETKTRCEELVGLDAQQFMRVVLLPQGDFDAFLLAKSQEREALLTTLFGTEVFERIVSQLKTERERLERGLNDTDNQIEMKLGMARDSLIRALSALDAETPEDIVTAERDRVASLTTDLGAPIGDLAAKVAALEEEADRASVAHEAARAGAARFDRATDLRALLADTDLRRPQVEADRLAARTSREARPVTDAADALESARTRRTKAAGGRDIALDEVRSGFASVGVTTDATDISSFAAQLSELDKANREHVDALEAAAKAAEALAEAREGEKRCQTEVERCREQLDTAIAHKKAIEAELPDPDEPLPDIDKIEESIEACELTIEKRTEYDAVLPVAVETAELATAAADRYDKTLTEYVKTTAPRLAGTLEHEMPCPVCGSTDHPAPAIASGGTPTTIEQVQQVGEDRDLLNNRSKELEAKLVALGTALGPDAKTPRDVLEERISELRTALEAAKNTASKIEGLNKQLGEAAETISQLKISLTTLTANLDNAGKRREDAERLATQAESSIQGIDPADVDRTTRVLEQLKAQIADLDPLFSEASAAEGEVTSAQSRLEIALDTSPFDSLQAARDSLMSPDDEHRYLQTAEHLDNEHAKATSALDEIESQGVPEQRPDVDALRDEARRLSETARHDRARLDRAEDNVRHAVGSLAEHDELVSGSSGLREQVDQVRLAHKVCNEGGQGIDMPLKRWVLTRELDRVTDAANVHLVQMTNHRYKLQRRQERRDARKSFGLDLEVMDAATGRPRPTTSLSGGEQFQASLSLALGLADVVSRGGTASGRRFEALFVDEGFGSLSADCLDDAIETLHQLQASGRMVGAITHVETMKQRLHVGIEVLRREDGKGSTLSVHP